MTAPAFTAAEKERLLLEGDRTMTARETADRLAEMTGGFDLRRDAIAAALDAAYRRGVEDAARAPPSDSERWLLAGDLAPTWDEIRRAGLKWCSSLKRETFLSDEHYFRNNWSSLPGLRAYVVREIADGHALAANRRAAILTLSPGDGR